MQQQTLQTKNLAVHAVRREDLCLIERLVYSWHNILLLGQAESYFGIGSKTVRQIQLKRRIGTADRYHYSHASKQAPFNKRLKKLSNPL